MVSVLVLLHIRIVIRICQQVAKQIPMKTHPDVGVVPMIVVIILCATRESVVASSLIRTVMGSGLMAVRWICRLMRRIVEIAITIAV